MVLNISTSLFSLFKLRTIHNSNYISVGSQCYTQAHMQTQEKCQIATDFHISPMLLLKLKCLVTSFAV